MAVDTIALYVGLAGAAAAYLVLSAFILPYLSQQSRYLRSQPWIGGNFFAGFRSTFRGRDMLLEGYKKYSKSKMPFVLPQLGTSPYVIIPVDKLHEFGRIGDDQLDHITIGEESVALPWTVGVEFGTRMGHMGIVRRQLTRKLHLVTTDVYTELVLGMQDQWPRTDEWQTVKVWATSLNIVARAANRVFSGTELCRSSAFLDASRKYATSVFMTGMFIRMFPQWLHPMLAPLATRGMKQHLAAAREVAIPVIKARIKEMQDPDHVPKNDVLYWMLEEILAGPADSHKRDPDWICRCLLILNMLAIHTTSIVTANTLMDLYSSPDREDFVAGLREEAQRVLTEHGSWTKDAVNSLVRIDSAIRESMRTNGLGDMGIQRIVDDKNGISLSDGVHIPYGTRVAVPAHAIHTDETFYPRADYWDAFRFSRPHEEYVSSEKTEYKNRSMVVTTDDFLTFGHGKHACPGRFFASQEIKLMLAHTLLNYDVEIAGGKRPMNLDLNAASVPSEAAEMRVRKRQ